MPVFVILARKRYGDKCIPMTQVRGAEGKAIDVAHKIYNKGGMSRTIVVDDQFKIIFKIDRRCKCINAQYRLDGDLKCEDCGRVINTQEYHVEEYQ